MVSKYKYKKFSHDKGIKLLILIEKIKIIFNFLQSYKVFVKRFKRWRKEKEMKKKMVNLLRNQ